MTALLHKSLVGTHREVEGEGDRATAGGETDHTIQWTGLSWHQLEHLSRDRRDWRDFVSGLCSEVE